MRVPEISLGNGLPAQNKHDLCRCCKYKRRHKQIQQPTVCAVSFMVVPNVRAWRFREHIGNAFSFNVAFQKWLKGNTGKTYKEAITAYYQILEDKKSRKTVIEKQFEYNTYIRDFFADNPGRTLDDAIKCWKYKKQLPGHNHYEQTDLAALD